MYGGSSGNAKSDWEAEYEEDRRRIMAGQQVDFNHRGHQGQQQVLAPLARPTATAVPRDVEELHEPVMGIPLEEARAQRSTEEAEIERFYAAQFADGGRPSQDARGGGEAYFNPRALPGAEETADPRYNLPFVRLPSVYTELFGDKFGRFLYFASAVEVHFKGFWSPKERPMLLLCTPQCVYLGDIKTGEILMCRHISQMSELLQLGESGLAIRSTSDADVICGVPTGLSDLLHVLTKLHGAFTTPLSSRSLSGDAEKDYRKSVRYFEPKELPGWKIIEDPRSGLPLVEIPEKFVPYYAPLVPKILHWFGGVFHVQRDWKGAFFKERRGCWVTATCLFLSLPDGPQRDGRDIRRCVGIEYIGSVVNGPGGTLGIVTTSGPKQPHLALTFDSMDVKDKMIFILRCCHQFRAKKPLKVQLSSDFEKEIVIDKEAHLKPELFLMKTREDLYNFLRFPTGKKR